jgi:hypothetical protein
MEEMQSIVKRIETDRDDLEAWQRLRELVDDPKKKGDCTDQVTRINNERCGVHTVIRCEQCGASMQVLSGNLGNREMAICPVCQHLQNLKSEELPVERAEEAETSSELAPPITNLLLARLPLIAILVSNLLPVFGILYLHWSMGSVMVLYWVENVIVGLFTILKIAFARAQIGSGTGKLAIIVFFCLHFGGFCLGHGIIIAGLFLPRLYRSWNWQSLLAELWVPILGMVISYGISFVQHYLRGGIYKRASLTKLMFEPYPRIVPLHFGIILGGFVCFAFGSPIWFVLMLIAFKTTAEVVAYRNSMAKWRSQAGGR